MNIFRPVVTVIVDMVVILTSELSKIAPDIADVIAHVATIFSQ
jgi:hypothetical protein